MRAAPATDATNDREEGELGDGHFAQPRREGNEGAEQRGEPAEEHHRLAASDLNQASARSRSLCVSQTEATQSVDERAPSEVPNQIADQRPQDFGQHGYDDDRHEIEVMGLMRDLTAGQHPAVNDHDYDP